MDISIVGFGNLGEALANAWHSKGHHLTIGTRNPKSESAIKAAEKGMKIGSISEAINANEIVLLAVPFPVAKTVLKVNPVVKDKIILDATNPLLHSALEGYETAAQAVAAWSGSKRVVKVFNSTGVANLENPLYNGFVIETFICGDNAPAKEIAKSLAKDVGFDVVDLGGLSSAIHLENLARLWIHLAYVQGEGPDFAFKILKRKSN